MQLIYAYAEGGGDGGITCRVLRRACGLPKHGRVVAQRDSRPADGVETAPQTPVAQPNAARAGEHWTQTATTMDMGATCGVPRVQGVEERLHPVSLFSATATTAYPALRPHPTLHLRETGRCHAASHQHHNAG